MCGTPKGYGNWSYEMYLKGKQDPEWDSFQYTTLQGGMVSEKELNQAKLDLDQRTFRQEFEGTFENYAGAIYNFHPMNSVVNKDIDYNNFFIGMGFNIANVSLCWSNEKEKDLYCR